MEPIQRIGIIANREIPNVEASVRRAMAVIEDAGGEVLLDTEMSIWLKATGGASLQDLATRAQLFLVFGGDGTFLRAARALSGQGVPLSGINMGSLGFLTVLRLEDMETVISEIMQGDYEFEERMLLRASLLRNGTVQESFQALNDAVIHMSHGNRLVEFSISVGGQYLGRYRADGLIVATPTGSTAYSMSAGGPIVHPTMDALVATPICAHALSIRPIVVGGEEEFEIRIGGRSGEAVLSLDGMINVHLRQGDEINICKAEDLLTMLHPKSFSYYRIVHEKLGWGGPDDVKD